MSNPKGNPATLKHYKPKWNNGSTRTIRVPVALADEILDYAHKLDDDTLIQVNGNDKGKSDIGSDHSEILANESLSETLTQVIEVLEEVCETSHSSKFTRTLKAKLENEAIAKLKSLTQVNDVAMPSPSLCD